jgi:methylmalonyl-CoA/ethylmalonyl-CoA epimerase
MANTEPQTPGTALGLLGQISMNAKDIARATAFYKDVLRLPHLFSVGTLSFFNCAGVRLMVGVASSAEYDHPGSVLYFKVDDIDAAHRELADRSVAFKGQPHLVAKMPDHELWMAFFSDTEGNTLALMEERRGSPHSLHFAGVAGR